jgi:formylglycine-generating enzyme required for sulfatase activity
VLGTGWRSEWNARLPASAQDLKNGIASCPGVGAPKIDSTWTDAPGANESRPMSCVTWYEAFAFCAWDGGRLPGAAEREYAATGGDEQRAYPWGNQAPDASRLTTTCYGTDGNVLPVPVGGFPTGAGKWGHQDLLGAGPQMLFDCEFPPPLQTRVSPFWLC